MEKIMRELEDLLAVTFARLECAETQQQVDEIQIEILGRKIAMDTIMQRLPDLSVEERPAVGQLVNLVKTQITVALAKKQAELKQGSE